MKTMVLAAVAAVGLGAGAAYAAGGPVGFEAPVYASQSFPDHSKDAKVQFLGPNTVIGKMLNYSSGNGRVAATTAPKG